jgi:arylsulfatase A-like enzyme
MNVVVICIDTLRYDYLGCYGTDRIDTPNIDRFAERAMRFDAAYCGSFPTVPIRTDAYTGDVNWPRYGWKGPDDDQSVFLDRLREQGYHTGLVLDTSNNVGAGLHEYYDEYTLIEKPVEDGITEDDIEVPFPRENVRADADQYVHQMVERSHYAHERDWFGAQTMLAAGDWLEEHADDDFFLWVDTFEPHEVWDAPEHYTDRYSPTYEGIDYAFPNYGDAEVYSTAELERMKARYAAEVTLTDRWVGHLLDHIQYLDLWDDTMVVLFGDHGMYLGDHGRVGKHTVDPSDPWPLYDEVAQLPLLVAAPQVDGGTSTEALAQPADIATTVLDVTGCDNEEFYGRSWVPTLRESTDDGWDAIYTSFYSWDGPGRVENIRSRITVTTPRWSLSVGPDSPSKLFDRIVDRTQSNDRADEHPEVVSDLEDQLAAFMRERGADPGYVETFVC